MGTWQVRVKSQPIVDPRGVQLSAPASLTARPKTLTGARLLLFDNGKLQPDYGAYSSVYETVKTELRLRDPEIHITESMAPLLAMDGPATSQLARTLAAQGADAAVVALCDSGVTQVTVLFVSELERHGVPVVIIGLEVARDLIAAAVRASVPGVPVVELTAPSAAPPGEVARQTRGIIDGLLAGLTTPTEELMRRFRAEDSAPSLGLMPGKSGELCIGNEVVARATDSAPGELIIEIDPGGFAEGLYERLCDAVMTDGFPVIPPTRPRVDAMLRFTDREPGHVMVEQLSPAAAAVTVEKLAVAAVMAGCRPEYFPIVLTAMEAMAEEPYRLFQAVITSHPGGNAVVVSGPLAREVGMSSGGGCLGPGNRANSTIGRAVNLCILNVGRSLPGRSDLAVFGSPAEYSYCVAEAGDQSPWSPYHVDLFNAETTTVTVHRCESPHNVLDHVSRTPESLLETIASVATTLGSNNAYVPGELLLFMNPEHARFIAAAGWNKRDVQNYLFEKARNPRASLIGRGAGLIRPEWMRDIDPIPATRSPDDILVFVAGKEGPASMVAIPWGYARAVTRPVTFQDGRVVRSVKEFVGSQG